MYKTVHARSAYARAVTLGSSRVKRLNNLLYRYLIIQLLTYNSRIVANAPRRLRYRFRALPVAAQLHRGNR